MNSAILFTLLQVESVIPVLTAHYTSSLSRVNRDLIDNGITGKSIGAGDGNMFTDASPTAPIRNTTCWLRLLDYPITITQQSFWNDARGASDNYKQHGCLIYSDTQYSIMALADHYLPNAPVGSNFKFCTKFNTVETSTIVAQTLVPDLATGVTDMLLCKMSPALSNNIGVFKVLPSDWMYYLPGMPIAPNSSGHLADKHRVEFPVVYSNQNKQAVIAEWWWEGSYFQGASTDISPLPVVDGGVPGRPTWYNGAISGDSGAMVVMLLGYGEFVLTQLFGASSFGPRHDVINEVMDSLIPGASLTSADLSRFSTQANGRGFKYYNDMNGFST